MVFESPFAAFDMEVEYGGRIIRNLPDLSHAMEDTVETALFLIAERMVDDLEYGRVPKKPWPILTGRSKGLPPFTGRQGGFFVDNADSQGWEIWSWAPYAGFVERGIAGPYRRKDGGGFIRKMWDRNEGLYFELAQEFFAEQ